MKKRNTVFSLVVLSVFIVSVALGIATAGDELNEKLDYLPTQDIAKIDEIKADSVWDWLLGVLTYLYNSVTDLQAEVEDIWAAILWTDADGYIYPNNVGTNFQITDTGNLYVPSNVGIGTATPSTRLTIDTADLGGDAARRMIKMIPGGTQDRVYIESTANYLDFIKRDAITDGFDGYLDITADTGDFKGNLKVFGAGPHYFDAGNVGIGTRSPTEKLHVVGKVKATEFVTGDITFQKNNESLWRMYEDEDGLYLENLKTGKAYRFVLQEVENEK